VSKNKGNVISACQFFCSMLISSSGTTQFLNYINCEVVQEMGELGEKAAIFLSDLKENYDQYTYIHTHHVSIEEAIADSERDQIANKKGREMGRKYPNCSCSILMKDLLPEYKKKQ